MAAEHTGQCLCGTVRLQITGVNPDVHACHCENCRRQSGVCTMTVMVPPDGLTMQGTEAVTTYQSSDWAARSFCSRCGTSLWYRFTEPGEQADYFLNAGLLDDLTGLKLTQEIYYDRKPDAWAFAGDTEKLTGAEVEALYAASPKE